MAKLTLFLLFIVSIDLNLGALAIPPEFLLQPTSPSIQEVKKAAGVLLLETPRLSVLKTEVEDYDESTSNLYVHAKLFLVIGKSAYQFDKALSGRIDSFSEEAGLFLGQEQVYRADWTIAWGHWEKQIGGAGQTYFIVRDGRPLIVFSTRTSYFDATTHWSGSLKFTSLNRSMYGFLQKYSLTEANEIQSQTGIEIVSLSSDGVPTEKFTELGFQAYMGQDNRIVVGLNDNRVNLRSEPSLNSQVIKVLSGEENLTLLDLSYHEDLVNGKKGHWVNVSDESNVTGWVWSDYLQTDFSTVPVKQYLRDRGTNARSYTKAEVRKFAESVKTRNLVAIKECLDDGFNFCIKAGFNGYRGSVFHIGLQSTDESFMIDYLKLLFKYIQNIHAYNGELAVYFDGNPLRYAIHIRNKAAVNAILAFRPDFLTRKLYHESGCGPLEAPVITMAIRSDDIEMTDYLLQKGFRTDWVYDLAGCGSVAPGGLYANLISWSRSKQMTAFLSAKGVESYIEFPQPWTKKLLNDAVLFTDLNRGISIQRSEESKISIVGINADTENVRRGNDIVALRYLKVIYLGKTYYAKSSDIDFGNLWDE